MLSGEIEKAVALKGIAATKARARRSKPPAAGRGLTGSATPRSQPGNGKPLATMAGRRPGDIRKVRFFFLFGALVVYRIGTFIPVPGIGRRSRVLQDQASTILGMVNMFSGGAMSRPSIFAMGVMPYISASIIVQMLSMVYPPSLMEYRKEGESGRRKHHPDHALRHGGPRRCSSRSARRSRFQNGGHGQRAGGRSCWSPP